MDPTLAWNNVWIRRGAIALLALITFTLLLAPQTERGSGSTYSRAPDGYGAWYAYMAEQGTPVQRWQKPFDELNSEPSSAPSPITLLQVNLSPKPLGVSDEVRQWVSRGNRLVMLGIQSPVTEAPFSTTHASSAGAVKIQTRRRLDVISPQTLRLGDRFGAIVLQESLGEGEVLYAVTPHLAANAYQDEPGNFPFLASLVQQEGYALWVDEYLHGYKDSETVAEEVGDSVFSYLMRTPLLPILLQGAVLLVVLLWSENQRFGSPIPLTTPKVDNSMAYMEALASVLHKAECHPFVVDQVGQAEQRYLQQVLGLGSDPVTPALLVNAWVQQTSRPASELEQAMRPYWKPGRSLSEADLLAWIQSIQALHRHLPNSES